MNINEFTVYIILTPALVWLMPPRPTPWAICSPSWGAGAPGGLVEYTGSWARVYAGWLSGGRSSVCEGPAPSVVSVNGKQISLKLKIGKV